MWQAKWVNVRVKIKDKYAKDSDYMDVKFMLHGQTLR